jgi:hypothetical protein
LRLTVDLAPGIDLAFGATGDTHMVPPRSQKILLVVMSSGKTSSTTQLSFKYISDTILLNCSERESTNRVEFGFGAIGEISMVGDLLCSNGDETSVSPRGSDTLDISSWIPQLGARV